MTGVQTCALPIFNSRWLPADINLFALALVVPYANAPLGVVLSCSVAMITNGVVPAPAPAYWLSSMTVTLRPGDTSVGMFVFLYMNMVIDIYCKMGILGG